MAFIELPNTFKIWKKKQFLYHNIDPLISSWLLDTESLTQRIIKHCQTQKTDQNSFRVQLLTQTIGNPSISEASRLKIKIRQWAYLREVLLHCGETPVVYAKTIIPLTTLTGKQRQLAFLGNRPLGAYLFSQPNLLRDEIEVSQINHQQQKLWARRSAFYLDHKPLLVYEVFLPDLLQAIVAKKTGSCL